MPPVPDEALRKLEDAKALMDELVDPFEDAERIGAELRDALLSFDRDAYLRCEEESERARRAQRRLHALWTQAKEAVEAGNGDRVVETARAIRFVSEREFGERSGSA